VARSHPRYPIHKAFKAALTSRVRSGRWPAEAEDMTKVMEAISAPYYEVDADEIWRNSSGTRHVAGAKVPLLVIHPDDDPIIKVEEAEKLAIAAAGNDLVRVWTVPHGSHGLLEAADPVWTNAVYREFFERWAVYAERGPVADRSNGKLVYSEE
jgi:pimeloyl-ACP methyl ester carboxylesterase